MSYDFDTPNVPELQEIKTEDEARQIAIDWQVWAGENDMSYGELAEWQSYFEHVASKFKLTDEFKENGII